MSEGKLKNCHTENIIIRDCHVASLLTMILILFSFSTHATCTPTPDCASIGYTETSCETKSVKCPFDTSKLFCLPCDTSFKYDCVGANITGSTGLACGGKYASCQCDTSLGYYFDKGVCACSDINVTNCEVGDIYYADGRCSDDFIPCRNAVGVVVKDNELVMSKVLANLTWGGYGVNINGITETSDSTIAKTDYNGKDNTLAIISQLTSGSAAIYCNEYSTEGTNLGQWYLPAVGELYSYIYGNYNKIYPTWVSKLAWDTHFAYYLLSSSERTDYTVWIIDSSIDVIGYRNKNANVAISCFLAIN